MPSSSVLTPWQRYKRYSDNVKLEARLVQTKGKKIMQVREPKGETYCCPECRTILTQGNGLLLPDFLLEPKVFHERHKPI